MYKAVLTITLRRPIRIFCMTSMLARDMATFSAIYPPFAIISTSSLNRIGEYATQPPLLSAAPPIERIRSAPTRVQSDERYWYVPIAVSGRYVISRICNRISELRLHSPDGDSPSWAAYLGQYVTIGPTTDGTSRNLPYKEIAYGSRFAQDYTACS